MGTLENTFLGIAFWAIGLANMLLMFKPWGYPFDHERLVSSAPKSFMLLHRLLGYVFLAIYVALMLQMAPRLWAYQVELPARTVAHLVMGIAIGAVLFVKILSSASSGTWSRRPRPCARVAISPDLQSLWLKRQQERVQVPANVVRAPSPHAKAGPRPLEPFDLAKAKSVFESTCNGCHSLRNIEQAPPTSEAAARELVARMVNNGLNADQAALEQIVGYLSRTYGSTRSHRTPGQAVVTAVQSVKGQARTAARAMMESPMGAR